MSNFLGEVLQAKGTASFEELSETLRTLESRISQLKIGVVQSLHSTFILYETDLDRVVQWFTQIQEVQDQLRELEKQLSEDKQVLSSAHQDLDSITIDLDHCRESISLLNSLVTVVRNLERVDPTDYYHASERIREAEEELINITVHFPTSEDHIWIKQLRARFSDLVVDVYDKGRKEWNNLFKFDRNCLSIHPHAVDAGALVKSLKNVKSFTRLWEKFCNLLWQELFKPACSRDYVIEVVSPWRNEYEVDKIPVREQDSDSSDLKHKAGDALKGVIVIKARKLDKPYSDSTVLFQNIIELVDALHVVFSSSAEELYSLQQIIAPKIDEELTNKHLKTLILHRCEGDIEKARGDLGKMQKFITKLKEKYDFEFPEGSVFEAIETNFEPFFKAQVRETLIVKLRELIRANVHDTVEINHESVPNSELSHGEIVLLRKNPKLFPKCVVSKSIAELVQLLKDHMNKYPKDYEMCSGVFSLYLALVKIPKHESDSGDLIPLTAVLIHNNSHYLAHQVGFTFDCCDDFAPDLRTKANQSIAFMMRCVRTKLNELITNAMSAVQERVDRNIDITHDFLVLTAELKRLNFIMNPVLPAIVWNDILATLVDHTVNELVLKVLAWEDISANSASELANAFTQFGVAASSLFKGDASSPREVEALTTRAVKKWQRFRLLIFVLTASMKEIESKWVGGCGPLANEYTAEEVRRLVRALFQNTDRRAAFLATIK